MQMIFIGNIIISWAIPVMHLTIFYIVFTLALGHRWHCLGTSEVTLQHYCDVKMGAMASQITSLTAVYSIVHSGADQRIHQSSASLAFVRGFAGDPAGEFPTQMASNAENVSI